MEASTGDLQAGSRIPVIIERIVKDTMVVTLDHGDRCFTGILIESCKKEQE